MYPLVSESIDDYSLNQFLFESIEELTNSIEKESSKINENLNESITIGAILASPYVIKSIGVLVKKLSKKFKWKKGEDAGEWLEGVAHKTENMFLSPIKFILKKVGVAKEKRDKWSKLIFASIIILFGVSAGINAVSAYKAAHVSHATAEGILAGLKAGETGDNLIKAVKSAGASAAAAIAA